MDHQTALTLLDMGLSLCASAFDRDGAPYAALFMAGLVGGWSHCTGMCGPFVLAQVAVRLERVPVARMGELHRLAGAAVLPYHFGRGTTYAGIGGAAALAAGSVTTLPGLRWLSVALLGFAALSFLRYALGTLGAVLPGAAGRDRTRSGLLARWSERVARVARPLLGSPTGWRGYLLGLTLGFIPCGFLYGAVAVAAASGSVFSGAFGMAAFAAGTVPSLLAVGLAGHAAGRTLRGVVARVAPVVMLANAGVLGFVAWRLITSA